jgi:hypothetical protein
MASSRTALLAALLLAAALLPAAARAQCCNMNCAVIVPPNPLSAVVRSFSLFSPLLFSSPPRR